jgi:L-asparaginase
MLKIFTTGGTLDKVYFDQKSEFQVGEPQVLEVLRRAGATVEHQVEPILRKDSLDLTDEDRALILKRVAAERADRIVVTHGTDTMIQTARVLKAVAKKTIVLTGAMQPALFRGSDADFNIGAAVAAAQCLPAGVYLAMNGRIWDPDRVRKNVEGNCFEAVPS